MSGGSLSVDATGPQDHNRGEHINPLDIQARPESLAHRLSNAPVGFFVQGRT